MGDLRSGAHPADIGRGGDIRADRDLYGYRFAPAEIQTRPVKRTFRILWNVDTSQLNALLVEGGHRVDDETGRTRSTSRDRQGWSRSRDNEAGIDDVERELLRIRLQEVRIAVIRQRERVLSKRERAGIEDYVPVGVQYRRSDLCPAFVERRCTVLHQHCGSSW